MMEFVSWEGLSHIWNGRHKSHDWNQQPELPRCSMNQLTHVRFPWKKHVWNHQIGTKIPSNFGQSNVSNLWNGRGTELFRCRIGGNQGGMMTCRAHPICRQTWSKPRSARGLLAGLEWPRLCLVKTMILAGNARIYAGMHILGSLRIRGLWSIKLTHISSHQWGLPDAGADPEQTPWSIGW